jgi:hypothetical protein
VALFAPVGAGGAEDRTCCDLAPAAAEPGVPTGLLMRGSCCQTRLMPEIMVLQVLRPGRGDVRAGELLLALGRRMGHKQLQADLQTGKARLWVDMNVWDAHDVITSHLDEIADDWDEHLRVPPPPPRVHSPSEASPGS